MSELTLDGLKDELDKFKGKDLSDTTVETLLIDAPRSVGTTVTGKPVTAIFGASVDLSIELLNDARDEDKDGMIDMGKGGDSATLKFDPRAAWLKYGISAKCTAAASASIGTATGGINGDRSVRLLCYRKHDRNASLPATIASDALRFVSALTLGDIAGLETGDVVAVAAGGGVKASVQVKWGDILSVSGGVMGRLAKSLGATDAMIEVDTGVSVAFDVAVDDTFQLSIACLGPDSYQVVLATTDRVESHGAATFGVSASLSAANAKALVDTLKSGWLGIPGNAWTTIDSATSLSKLPGALQTLVAKAIERMHLPTGGFDGFKAKLKAFDDECTKVLKSFAEAKVTLAFNGEYRRLEANSSLITAKLDGAALKRHHPRLLLFDIDGLRADKAVTVECTVIENTVSSKRAWNFTLGFGSWLNIGSAEAVDAEKHQRIVETPDGVHRTCSFAGNIADVDSVWVGHKVQYGLLLKADTEFSTGVGGAQVSRSDGALGLWWGDSKMSVDKKGDRARLLDDAVIFGLVTPDGVKDLDTRLAAITQGTKGVRFDLSFAGDAMRRAMSVFATATHDDWARHTARALPWRENSEQRGSPDAREKTFGDFLQRYGHRPNIDVGAMPGFIDAYFKRDHMIGEWMWTHLSPSDESGSRLWPRWDALDLGSRHFSDLLQGTATDWDTFVKYFHDRFATAKQTLLVRAMVGLLAERLYTSLHDDPAYSVSLTIGGPDAGATRVVFG